MLFKRKEKKTVSDIQAFGKMTTFFHLSLDSADADSQGQSWRLSLVSISPCLSIPLSICPSIVFFSHASWRARAKILVSCPLPFISTRHRLCYVPTEMTNPRFKTDRQSCLQEVSVHA